MNIASQNGDSQEPRIIKRYANRKLYDTRASRYVTLQKIAGFVRDGEDVQIIDNESKEDLTNVTLAQIIYEQEKNGGNGARSVMGVREFIYESRERLLATLRGGPIAKLVPKRDEKLDPDDSDDASAPKSGNDGIRAMVTAPREAWDELQRLADDRVRALISSASGHIQQLQSEVRRLQDRIEELESNLVNLTRRAKKSDGGASDGLGKKDPPEKKSDERK